MKLSVRFLLSFLLFFLTFSGLFTQSTYAQSINQTPQNSYTAPNTNPDVPNNLHNYTQNVLIEVMSAVACQLTGIDPTSPTQQCLGVDPNTKKIGFVNGDGGAIGFMGNMITMLYTPPLHTGDYFKYLAQDFGIVKHTYAAPTATQNGIGFQGIAPLLALWTVFRNIVYLIFVLVFVIIGVAIMFRVKIDPRTVMTIQNQIPKIIIAIILVTFTFAIAGFLIDLMYTSIYLTGNAIASADKNLQKDNTVVKLAQSSNPLAAANDIGGSGGNALGLANIAWEPAKAVGSFISPIFDNTPGKFIVGLAAGYIGKSIGKKAGKAIGTISRVAGAVIGLAACTAGTEGVAAGAAAPACIAGGAKIGDIVGNLLGGVLGIGGAIYGVTHAQAITGFIVSLIAFVIIAIALLWALFRLWFALISAYIFILLDIVLAPFWIVAGAFPGSPISFTGWLRNLIANLAAFPAAIVMFLIGGVFIDAFGSSNTAGQFVPPLITNPSSTKAIGALIGLGIILATPSVVNMMKAALKAPKIDLSTVGTAIGTGPRVAGGAFGTVSQAIGLRYQWSALNNVGGFFGRKPAQPNVLNTPTVPAPQPPGAAS